MQHDERRIEELEIEGDIREELERLETFEAEPASEPLNDADIDAHAANYAERNATLEHDGTTYDANGDEIPVWRMFY